MADTVTEYEKLLKQYGQSPTSDALKTANSVVNGYTSYLNNANKQALKQSRDLSGNIYGAVGDLQKRSTDLTDYNQNYNPYTSDIGKAIANSYKEQGGLAARDAASDSAASNGGNLDSYAAANANRQQLASRMPGMRQS